MTNKTSKEIQVKDLDNWKKGQISYFSKSRTQEDALKALYNGIIDYNGIARPRGSFLESGIPDVGTDLVPLGADLPFKRSDGTEGLINVFSNGTTAHAWALDADGLGWTELGTVNYNLTNRVSLAQAAQYVVIGDGVTNFSYFDIASNTLKQFVAVSDPSGAPAKTATGFTGTAAFDYYWRVSFNGIGGTTASSSATAALQSSMLRDSWASNSRSVSISISGLTIDPNAQSWNLHVASVPTGTGAPVLDEYFGVAKDIPIAQLTYIDTGEVTLLNDAPVENTTAGIVAKYFTNISGRLWAIDDEGVVHWGGDPGNELYFGSSNGSDSYSISNDGAEEPVAITLGRDNSGTTCINLLTRTMAGQGAIWDVYATTNSVTANGQTYSTGTYQFKKREGNDGTDAPFSVIHENNNTYYLSMEGFKSTGVKPNVAGIQSTDIISSAIRDRVLNLSKSNIQKCYAAYYDEALYWTINYGSSANNQIWMYDLLHGGIWAIWDREADCIFRWSPSINESPSLYIRKGSKLLRYYKDSRTHSDYDGVFRSEMESGLIPFGENRREWVHVLKALWQFDQVVGVVGLTLNVHSKNGDIIKSSPVSFNRIGAISGGWDTIRPTSDMISSEGAWNNRNWIDALADLTDFTDPTDKTADQKIRKNAAYVSFRVVANTPNTYYELSHLSLLYTYIGVGVEFLSRRGVIKI